MNIGYRGLRVKEKRVAAFTANGTWTVPAGVTYAIAHVMGGGGGVGLSTTGGDGGASSAAFSGGTVTGPGLTKVIAANDTLTSIAGAANTGQNAQGFRGNQSAYAGASTNVFVVGASTVSPAESVTVTVGAGGSAGTNGAAGGSGYVFIEYYE